MGSYSQSSTKDQRTVIEGATKATAPESALAESLGAAYQTRDMQWSSIKTMLPGAIEAGGNVTVQSMTPELQTLIDSVMQNSIEQTEAAMAQAKTAIEEISEVTQQLTGTPGPASVKVAGGAVTGKVGAVLIAVAVVFFIMKGRK